MFYHHKLEAKGSPPPKGLIPAITRSLGAAKPSSQETPSSPTALPNVAQVNALLGPGWFLRLNGQQKTDACLHWLCRCVRRKQRTEYPLAYCIKGVPPQYKNGKVGQSNETIRKSGRSPSPIAAFEPRIKNRFRFLVQNANRKGVML